MANDQNPYTSALIATAAAQAEAKRKLNAAEAAVAAYPDNSSYQAQLELNQQQLSATERAYKTASTNFNSANTPIAAQNSAGKDTGTNGDLRTVEQTQSTPANPLNITNDDSGDAWAPTKPGAGAGSGQQGGDNNPGPNTATTQQAVNSAFATQLITPRPNVLDQYASYTYAISWWLLTPEQYNNLSTVGGKAPAPNTGNWTLLIQSGGAPTTGRNQFFPVDYYFDDLEIESFLMGKGTGLSNNGMEIRFKIVEPNGITLIQKLYDAVVSAYKNPAPAASTSPGNNPTVSANQSSKQTPNYAAAQYCLTIQFYGYDSQGNLVAPATGSSGTGPQAVIKKYYPFLLNNISFRTVANQVEYNIIGYPVPYDTGTAQARGTIPFGFALAGTTVSQLLQGGPLAATTNTRTEGRRTQPTPPVPALDPFELNDTGFATNEGGAAFGNPNLTRQGRRSNATQ